MRHLGRMPISFGLRLIAQAIEERRKEQLRQQWLVMLPWMKEYKPFEQFYEEHLHFAKLAASPRSREAILADARSIREKAKQQTA